jgi:hypothetical protein
MSVAPNTRMALPDRRHAETFAFHHEGHDFRVTIGCDPLELIETERAVPAEIFVTADRVDSGMDALAADAAILISMLLQYGAEPAAIGHALRRNPNNSRSSIVGALVDCVAGFSFTQPARRPPAAEGRHPINIASGNAVAGDSAAAAPRPVVIVAFDEGGGP